LAIGNAIIYASPEMNTIKGERQCLH